MSERTRQDEFGAPLDRGAQEAGDEAEAILREIVEAAELLGEVLAKPAAERQGLVREVRFHGLKLCQLLQERSEELWCENPVAGVELARLAVQISGFLDESHYGKGLAEDTRALSWACLGNAYRVASDLRRAEEALDQAEAHLEQSGGEAYTEAQILSFRASLRSSQGRFREAVKLLDRALAIYSQAKDHHLQGKTLIKKAAALAYDGKLQRAVRLARRGLSLIDPLEEPRLLVTAQHNLIGYLSEAGSPDQALGTLRKARNLYQDLGEPSHLARLSWLEGRILRDLGRLAEAEAALKKAYGFFVQHGIGLDAARVLLDLATVYAQRGETAELKRLAAEMVPVFASRDVHPEALAALALFQKAAEAEQVDRGLLEGIASSLRRGARSSCSL
ncbi:MAG TPA: tetratricopeptide repeat protein [Thermoanaerobaculia bacterium]|jgi:tetratricopeptide (TPR) repeat protein|nr:tetratricopeptide repeat protein [Thermoanaerobaculia bacterium]